MNWIGILNNIKSAHKFFLAICAVHKVWRSRMRLRIRGGALKKACMPCIKSFVCKFVITCCIRYNNKTIKMTTSALDFKNNFYTFVFWKYIMADSYDLS